MIRAMLKNDPIGFPFKVKFKNGNILAYKNSREEQWLLKNGFIRNKRKNGIIPARLHNVDSEWKGKYEGSLGYIVGKGPSLDYLTSSYFENKEAPIIGINEAYMKLKELRLPNPIYFVQLDIPRTIYVEYEDYIITIFDNVQIFYKKEKLLIGTWHHNIGFLSTTFAIDVMQYFGIGFLKMFCFDALEGIEGYPDWLNKNINYVITGRFAPKHIVNAEKVKIALESRFHDQYEVILPKENRLTK